MIGSLNSGVGAMRSFVKGIEVTGSNIANVNTVGYKGARARFEEEFNSTLQRGAGNAGVGAKTYTMQVGNGNKMAAVATHFSQGQLQTTGGKTDLGISGEGFFRVRDTQLGVEYVTRAGDFHVDDQGYLITNNGLRVQGLGLTADDTDGDADGVPDGTFDPTAALDTANLRDLRIDYRGAAGDDRGIDSFEIDTQGNIRVFLSDGSSLIRGQVLLQRFQDLSMLVKEGNNLYRGMNEAGSIGAFPDARAATDLSVAFGGATDYAKFTPGGEGLGRVIVGTLELSNVDLTEEFANLISNQRAFQAASRLITTSDDLLQEIVNLKR